MVLNQERTASSSKQDSISIGQDGKDDDRTVSRWAETQSRYRIVDGH